MAQWKSVGCVADASPSDGGFCTVELLMTSISVGTSLDLHTMVKVRVSRVRVSLSPHNNLRLAINRFINAS